MKKWIMLPLAALLFGCGGSTDDLKAFLDKPGVTPARLSPLAQVEQPPQTPYQGANEKNPFTPSLLKQTSSDERVLKHINRPRQPLEIYGLDQLTMVGYMQEGKTGYALIRTPTNEVYRIGVAGYMGTNFGQVVSVSPKMLTLLELLQEGDGKWAENKVEMPLQEITDSAAAAPKPATKTP